MKTGRSIGEQIQIQNGLMAELITACLGDKAKAIRLLEYERHRDPSLKTMTAIEMALDRLCRDRGGIKRPASSTSTNGTNPSWLNTSSRRTASQKKSGPPDVSIRMVLSVLLACAVVVGFIKVASSSLQPRVLPSVQSEVSIPPVSMIPPSVIQEQIPVLPTPQPSTPEPHYSSGIFRCTINGKTVYSDSACGTPVTTKRLLLPDTSGGFVSPPKERLEDLTANRLTSEQAYQRNIQAQAVENRIDARKAECEDLARRVNWLDASAREPQSGQMQDWIRADKARVQTRQFDLHC